MTTGGHLWKHSIIELFKVCDINVRKLSLSRSVCYSPLPVRIDAPQGSHYLLTVFKVSSLIRTDLGLGHLVLTEKHLLLLKAGAQVDSVKEVARLGDINSQYLYFSIHCLPCTVISPVQLSLLHSYLPCTVISPLYSYLPCTVISPLYGYLPCTVICPLNTQEVPLLREDNS